MRGVRLTFIRNPNVTLGVDGKEVRISIECGSEAEAKSYVDYFMNILRTQGQVMIPIHGTPDDMVQEKGH